MDMEEKKNDVIIELTIGAFINGYDQAIMDLQEMRKGISVEAMRGRFNSLMELKADEISDRVAEFKKRETPSF